MFHALIINALVTPLQQDMRVPAKLSHCVLSFRDLSYGKGSTSPLRNAELPKIEDRDPWDGKDAEVNKCVSIVAGEGLTLRIAFVHVPLKQNHTHVCHLRGNCHVRCLYGQHEKNVHRGVVM